MRNLAIEAILRRPDYYVTGTLQRFFRMADGSVERLRDARNTADTARQRWEDEASKNLLVAATPAEDRAAPVASAMVSIWQPGYIGPVLPFLALIGTIGGADPAAWRPAVALGLAALALLFISAALVGNVSRYRYPVDPMLAVLAVGGVAWLVMVIRVSGWSEAGPPPGRSVGGRSRRYRSWGAAPTDVDHVGEQPDGDRLERRKQQQQRRVVQNLAEHEPADQKDRRRQHEQTEGDRQVDLQRPEDQRQPDHQHEEVERVLDRPDLRLASPGVVVDLDVLHQVATVRARPG